MNFTEKETWLRETLMQEMQKLQAETPAKWGNMNAQQMTEHLADSFGMANGREVYDLLTDPVHLPKYQEFLLSEKPFRPGTSAPYLPAEPQDCRQDDLQDAKSELAIEIENFFSVFSQNRDTTVTHPVFGPLNYDHWVQLLQKHSVHHLNQFGLNISDHQPL